MLTSSVGERQRRGLPELRLSDGLTATARTGIAQREPCRTRPDARDTRPSPRSSALFGIIAATVATIVLLGFTTCDAGKFELAEFVESYGVVCQVIDRKRVGNRWRYLVAFDGIGAEDWLWEADLEPLREAESATQLDPHSTDLEQYAPSRPRG